MVKVFKFRPNKNNKNRNEDDFKQNLLNSASSASSGKIVKFVALLFSVFLILNLLNLANELKFQSQICAVLWFLLSFSLIICVYKFTVFSGFVARFVMVFTAFCGGFFASALYFGYIAQNAFEFGGVCALLTLFFSFGFAVIV